ncbi:MAG: DUF3467 domain-containing protein [Candidatus Aenigmarchaeota archaeon]|nr:DUF3467 domain-containing protein [Candidatus Aenigmarchaeota archaeon]
MAEKQERVNLKIDHNNDAFFTDNVSVLHNPSKFIIDFSQTVPRLDNVNGKMQQTFTIKHDTVIMDPQFAKSFADILQKNVKAFEKKFGTIKMPKKKSVKKKYKEVENTRYIG